MFKKPFKVKSNSQIKSSERKILKENLLKSFPAFTESEVDSILPKKEVAYCMKILTFDNNIVLVYLLQKRVIAFEFENVLYPSVYLLWKYNNLVLTFTTNSFVVTKLNAGADLMLPGVIINPQGYGVFSEKSVCCVNSNNNKLPVAVGVTAISSRDMALLQWKGKCVLVYHFYGDKLCSLEDLPVLPIPQLGPPDWLNYSLQNADDFPALTKTPNVNKPIESDVNDDIIENKDDVTIEATESEHDENMDELLIHCFLTAVKYSKTLELPMLTSSFYKLEVMPNCPDNKTLDIKKSSFKKVGQFLKHMTKEGVIVVKEKKKGVETVESINREHPILMDFYVESENRPKKPVLENENNIGTPNIVECYVVTNAVEAIFKEFGFKKGDSIQLTDIRRYITTYVKSHNCQSEANKRFVNVTQQPLASICKNENAVAWEELIEKICGAMKSCFKVSSHGEEMVSKGKIQPIVMTVQTRSGNKKVTLVDNIELFGIRISEFAKECQHGVAASTSISRPPGKKSDQLLIQGNQVLFIYNLLIEKYKIPKKYIRGLENAPKVKK